MKRKFLGNQTQRERERERERERAEVRVFFCSELEWGGNGGERKRNFRSKNFFFFPGK